jgi:hypothetical protein
MMSEHDTPQQLHRNSSNLKMAPNYSRGCHGAEHTGGDSAHVITGSVTSERRTALVCRSARKPGHARCVILRICISNAFHL